MKNSNIHNTVYTTTNYEMFNKIQGNRKLNKRNYAKLISSMKEKQLTIPIIVNSKMEIIDGQHRFACAQELGLPVYFIVENDYGIDEVKRANMVGSNWNKNDFLQMHVDDEISSYIAFNEIVDIYDIKISDLIKLTAIIKEKNMNIVAKSFEEGTFTLSDAEVDAIYLFLESLESFNFFKFYKTKQFLTAFMKLYFHNDYDHERMEDRLRTRNSKLVKKSSAKEYLQCLTKDIYSFGAIKKPLFYDMSTDRFYS